jgi:hypothetical protein
MCPCTYHLQLSPLVLLQDADLNGERVRGAVGDVAAPCQQLERRVDAPNLRPAQTRAWTHSHGPACVRCMGRDLEGRPVESTGDGWRMVYLLRTLVELERDRLHSCLVSRFVS